MIRNTAFLALLMLVFSFSEDIPSPGEPEEMEEPAEVDDTTEDSAYPICGFDLDQEWADEDEACQGRFKLETRTHLGVLHSCFSYDEQGAIGFEVGLPYWDFFSLRFQSMDCLGPCRTQGL